MNPDNPNCPAKLGPDYDFSASPSLVTVNGRDLLVLPQKSGMAYALDPDNEGHEGVAVPHRPGQRPRRPVGRRGRRAERLLRRVGSADAEAGRHARRQPGDRASWRGASEPQKRLCDDAKPTCRASQGAAVTVIPGAVFSGSLDGGMRAYSTKDGSILWTFDTNKEFPTVNGVKANGGGIEGPGAIVAGGMLFFNSGYGGFVGNPGERAARVRNRLIQGYGLQAPGRS